MPQPKRDCRTTASNGAHGNSVLTRLHSSASHALEHCLAHEHVCEPGTLQCHCPLSVVFRLCLPHERVPMLQSCVYIAMAVDISMDAGNFDSMACMGWIHSWYQIWCRTAPVLVYVSLLVRKPSSFVRARYVSCQRRLHHCYVVRALSNDMFKFTAFEWT